MLRPLFPSDRAQGTFLSSPPSPTAPGRPRTPPHSPSRSSLVRWQPVSRPLCRRLSGQALCWRRCPAGLRPGLIEPRNTTAQTVHVCPSACLSPSHTDTRCQHNRHPRSASRAPALRGAGGRQRGASAGNDCGTCLPLWLGSGRACDSASWPGGTERGKGGDRVPGPPVGPASATGKTGRARVPADFGFLQGGVTRFPDSFLRSTGR